MNREQKILRSAYNALERAKPKMCDEGIEMMNQNGIKSPEFEKHVNICGLCDHAMKHAMNELRPPHPEKSN